ncbi:MAG: hypothetical protein AAB391_00985 [Patescibacteria group bacterium]
MKTNSSFRSLCQMLVTIILGLLFGLLALGAACFSVGDHTAVRHIAICASSFLAIGIPWWRCYGSPVLKAKEEDERRLKDTLRRVQDQTQVE